MKLSKIFELSESQSGLGFYLGKESKEEDFYSIYIVLYFPAIICRNQIDEEGKLANLLKTVVIDEGYIIAQQKIWGHVAETFICSINYLSKILEYTNIEILEIKKIE